MVEIITSSYGNFLFRKADNCFHVSCTCSDLYFYGFFLTKYQPLGHIDCGPAPGVGVKVGVGVGAVVGVGVGVFVGGKKPVVLPLPPHDDTAVLLTPHPPLVARSTRGKSLCFIAIRFGIPVSLGILVISGVRRVFA